MSLNLILVGMALCGASALLFNARLIQLQSFLKSHCPAIWEEHGAWLEKSNILVRYSRLRRIPFEYESDNELVNLKLKQLVWIHKSTAVGLLVMIAGTLIDIFA